MCKVTFTLPADLVSAVRQVVAAGIFPSQNALVREALEKELRRARDQQLRAEFQEAARDPLFMQDLEETQKAFEAADAETARMIPDG
jgi:Arc/MetJ-type ribon-helix-helix transcriptional regulator